MAHNFRPKSQWFFFAYVKIPKICKLQDAQKCRPWAEFGIWQDGSSSFHGTISFWAFQLARLAGKAIFSNFPVAPPIIISEISEKSEMIIGGATGGGDENGLSCQFGKLKSSESDYPMKTRWPILSDSKFSTGPAFLSILNFVYFWLFCIGKKKIYVSWVWNYVPYHAKCKF